jgi:hypothetical protein
MGSPEEFLLPRRWRFQYGPATDPVDMEYVIRDLDPALKTRVLAAQLDAVAKVQGNIADIHRNIAEGAQNIAKIIRAGK